MVNLFDTANYPEAEPVELVAGDQWAWNRPDLASTYDPSGHSLSYVANAETTCTSNIKLSATGDEYTVLETDTGDYLPGEYGWEAHITRTSDGARVRVASGYWLIKPNLAAGSMDTRSHAKIVLDAVEAVIEGTATKHQSSMSIAGRSLELRTYEELKMMRSDYRAEVRKERQSELQKQGKGGTNKILTRFPA